MPPGTRARMVRRSQALAAVGASLRSSAVRVLPVVVLMRLLPRSTTPEGVRSGRRRVKTGLLCERLSDHPKK